MPAHRVEIPREVREAVIAAHRARVPVREIADRHFGGSLSRAQSYLHRLRHQEGVDLPSRYPARDGEVPAATTPQRPAFDLTGFCAKGRTLEEICKRAGWTPEEAKAQLVEREGFDLFRHRNRYGEPIFLYLPKPPVGIRLGERVWKYRKQPGGKPYLMVEFPDANWDKIKIQPVSDVHLGHVGFDEEKFREYVNWIASEPNVFPILLGDEVENALDNAKGAFDQTMQPGVPQVTRFCQIYAPIAHKTLCMVPSNHLGRSQKLTNIDPAWIIADKLDIPYFGEPVFMDVLWRGNPFSFHIQHGVSNAQTAGGKLNAATRPITFQDFVHFAVSGHVHWEHVGEEVVIVRDPVNFDLLLMSTYVVICGSFLNYWGTYASRAGYKPGATGCPTCIIHPDGRYHASA
jgi:hypothetical protein